MRLIQANTLAALQTLLDAEIAASRYPIGSSFISYIDDDLGLTFVVRTDNVAPVLLAATLTEYNTLAAAQAAITALTTQGWLTHIIAAPKGNTYVVLSGAPTDTIYENSRAVGSALALTTDVALRVLAIGLPKGVFDVSGSIAFTVNAITTVQDLIAAVSAVDASIGVTGDGGNTTMVCAGAVISTSAEPTLTTPTKRITLAAAGNVYLNARAKFAVSSIAAFGYMRAVPVQRYF